MLGGRPLLSRLLFTQLVVRWSFLLGMAVVCDMLPPHNPGDDVVQFDTYLDDTDCVVRRGSFCDTSFHGRSNWGHGTGGIEESCIAKVNLKTQTSWLQEVAYPFLLRPLTRWDAARYLRLAYAPQYYTPRSNSNNNIDSEEAHAFFPLVPAAIQATTAILDQTIIPDAWLPINCAQRMVLAAYIWNTLCSLVAMAALYGATRNLLRDLSSEVSQKWAYRVALGFIGWNNPALVFFQVAYSEATFAALVFSGVYLSTTRHRWGVVGAGVLWTLAAATRSNGILYAGFLLLEGSGRIMRLLSSSSYNGMSRRLIRLVGVVMQTGILIGWIVMILHRHDTVGWNHHCAPLYDTKSADPPEWCQTTSSFSLYQYMQKKHWNVGLLNYYQWKQLPNFLLAAPIMLLSFQAVTGWIRVSWQRHQPTNVFGWVVAALATSAGPQQEAMLTDKSTSKAVNSNDSEDDTAVRILTQGPQLLGHYAVLAAAATIGLLIAHVQISTRMICSTCPALYWYMAATAGGTRGNAWIRYYCLVYIVLGMILHPAWLPWT